MTSESPVSETSSVPVDKRSSWFWLILAILLIIGLLGLTAGVTWAVSVKHSQHAVIRKMADVLPIPAAKLGEKKLLYRDFLRARDTLRTFLSSSAAKEQEIQVPLDAALEKNVLEKMLTQAALEELAAQKNVTVSDTELRQTFSEVIAAASSTTPDVSVYLLENFGWNEEDFRQQVLRPALLEERLAVALRDEQQGDPNALGMYLEKRLQEEDVVRYLRF